MREAMERGGGWRGEGWGGEGKGRSRGRDGTGRARAGGFTVEGGLGDRLEDLHHLQVPAARMPQHYRRTPTPQRSAAQRSAGFWQACDMLCLHAIVCRNRVRRRKTAPSAKQDTFR